MFQVCLRSSGILNYVSDMFEVNRHSELCFDLNFVTDLLEVRHGKSLFMSASHFSGLKNVYEFTYFLII